MNKIFLKSEQKSLPYSLYSLKVKDFQGIKYLHIQDLPCDAQWIFLVGENGFGKTSVLRSIGVGFSPIKTDSRILSFYQDDRRNMSWDNSALPLVGYGIARFNLSINKQPSLDPINSLFADDTILESIEQEIKDYWYEKENTRFQAIKNLLCTIIPVLVEITVKHDKKSDKKQVFYTEKGIDGNFQEINFNDLATGYRNIIAMIGDMLIRLRRMQHESIVKEDFKNYEGIVIIDEFDAHLHPKYQYELPKLLSSVFPKVQFIVATHSPIPLLGAPKNSAIVLNVNRTVEEGITIARSPIDFSKLNANAILTSPIFGFDETHFDADTESASIQPFDNYSEIEENNRIKENIKRLRAKGLIR